MPNYLKIIRESVEFDLEDIQAEDKTQPSNDTSKCDKNRDYEILKKEVTNLLRRKIDDKKYKQKINKCRMTAMSAQDDHYLGKSHAPLRNAWRKVKNSQ